MNPVARRLAVGISTALVLAFLLIGPASAQPISPASQANPQTGVWAYGAQHNLSISGTAADGNTSFTLHASYGWNTILTQRNVSNRGVEVGVNRTVGASLFVTYCRPDCNAPTRTLNITERVWESENASANLTTMGTVYSSGIPAQAVALENSSVRLRGNLTESATAVVNTLRGKASASEHFAVETSGRATVSFSPALGLFPNNLSLPTWNSSSAYTASGSWSIQTSFATVPFFGAPASSSRVYPGSFSDAQGTVAVVGSTDGPRTLANGQLTTQVLLSVSGPFTSWEGFILLPNGSDLLSSSSAPWDTDPVGAQIALPQTIDVQDPSAVGHLPILASATRYQPSATDSGAVSLDSGVTSALTGVGSSGGNGTALMDGPGASTIQAQPESVPAAEKSSNCLISGCGSAGAGLRVDRGLVLGIAIVVVGVVIAAVVVMRQPPRSEPPSRNASLYPRTSTSQPPPPAKGNGNGKSAPASDTPDPLGNLW